MLFPGEALLLAWLASLCVTSPQATPPLKVDRHAQARRPADASNLAFSAIIYRDADQFLAPLGSPWSTEWPSYFETLEVEVAALAGMPCWEPHRLVSTGYSLPFLSPWLAPRLGCSSRRRWCGRRRRLFAAPHTIVSLFEIPSGSLPSFVPCRFCGAFVGFRRWASSDRFSAGAYGHLPSARGYGCA